MALRMKSMSAIVRTQFEGIHCYPDAPEEVSFLRFPHRHTFNVEVAFDVFDDNREVEFIMAKHRLNRWLDAHKDNNGVWNMDTLSCEQVAKMIFEFMSSILSRSRTLRNVAVAVYEDNENGAMVCGDMA